MHPAVTPSSRDLTAALAARRAGACAATLWLRSIGASQALRARRRWTLVSSVGRADVVALLPPIAAKAAFDAVLTASQIAEQTAAAARTDAARIEPGRPGANATRLVTEAARPLPKNGCAPPASMSPRVEALEDAGDRHRTVTRCWSMLTRNGSVSILRQSRDVTGSGMPQRGDNPYLLFGADDRRGQPIM